MKFLTEYIKKFIKIDTILAFIVALVLNYLIYKNVKKALIFSVLFVIVFLFFLNLINLN
jgi:hypothetical protein